MAGHPQADKRRRNGGPYTKDMLDDFDPANLELDGLEAVLAEAFMRQGPLIWFDRESPREYLKALAELARRKAREGTLDGPDPRAVADLVHHGTYRLAALVHTDAQGTPYRLRVWRIADEAILAEWTAPDAPDVQEVLYAAKFEATEAG